MHNTKLRILNKFSHTGTTLLTTAWLGLVDSLDRSAEIITNFITCYNVQTLQYSVQYTYHTMVVNQL